jgi:LysR family transcriptional regulator, nitrogen assimilation regulatory protein
MDLERLKSFVSVVELGSLTKAAAALNSSPSVLSRRIRQLETELRQHLLYRDGRGVTPTESGKRLIAHGRGILHQVEMAQQDLATHRTSPVGKVAIGLPISIGKRLTVNLVTVFKQQYPDASINILVGQTDTLSEWLLRGRIDFALLYNPPPATQFLYDHLVSEDLRLIGSTLEGKGSPKTVRMADLPKYPLIVHSLPNTLRNRIDLECRSQNVVLTIAMEIDAIDATLDLIERGYGYAILSSQIIRDQPERKLQAANIVSPRMSRHLYIATFAQRPLTNLAELAISCIKLEVKHGLFADPELVANKKKPAKTRKTARS